MQLAAVEAVERALARRLVVGHRPDPEAPGGVDRAVVGAQAGVGVRDVERAARARRCGRRRSRAGRRARRARGRGSAVGAAAADLGRHRRGFVLAGGGVEAVQRLAVDVDPQQALDACVPARALGEGGVGLQGELDHAGGIPGDSLTAWPPSSPRRSPGVTSKPRGRPSRRSRAAPRCSPRRTISERAGGVVALKAENLQSTGSFKVRGAASEARGARRGGLHGAAWSAASAGNHAQAVAAAARTMGVPCEVFVPADAPIAKTEAARGLGAIVHLGGASVDECLVSAPRARARGRARVRPPVRRPGRRRRPGHARARAARGRARPRQGRRAGRRRRAVQRDRDRDQVGAARGRGRRRAGGGVRALHRVAQARRAGRGRRRRSRSPTASRSSGRAS